MRRANQGGFAFIAALLVMLVLAILVVALLTMTIAGQQLAASRHEYTQALFAAEAGLNALVSDWRLRGVGDPPPQPYIGEFENGDRPCWFSVTWTAPDADGVVTASSVGWANPDLAGTVYSLSRIVQVDLDTLGDQPGLFESDVFDYAIFSDSDFWINGNVNVTGGIHSNGNATIEGNPTIDGDLSAGGSITMTGDPVISGDVTPYAGTVEMPLIDLDFYRSIADTIIEGDYNTKEDPDFGGHMQLDGILFIDGDLTFDGNIGGLGVIVVTGNVFVDGNMIMDEGEGNEMGLICAGGITVDGNMDVAGAVYAHGLTSVGGFGFDGNVDILGSLVADDININGNLHVEYNAPTVSVPGTEVPAEITPIARSWREM